MSQEDLSRAYTTIASDYDRLMEGDAWMRPVLWDRYLHLFSAREHVLDVGCGTGSDAIFLAQNNRRVTGIDISPGMIDQLQTRAEQNGLGDQVNARVLDLTDLRVLLPQRFAGIISAFGGLNTVLDLRAFATDAAYLLEPRGRLFIHMINRFSIWEWYSLVQQGQLGQAMALRNRTTRTITIGGKPIRHYLPYPQKIYSQFFKTYFELNATYALGFIRAPGALADPDTVERVEKLEKRWRSRWPFRNWGRFFVLEMTRRAGL